jgi:uncharacterized protein YjbJ (UPF0337 family)
MSTREAIMNQEQFKQSWYQLEGHLRKQWGKLTNEDYAQIDGDLEKFNGVIEQRYGEMKEEVSKWADRWYAKWIGWYQGYEEAKSPG